jgi:hypothetical protein
MHFPGWGYMGLTERGGAGPEAKYQANQRVDNGVGRPRSGAPVEASLKGNRLRGRELPYVDMPM